MKHTIVALLFGTTLFSCVAGRTARAAVLRVPEEFPTIQAGIDAADQRDTVLVGPGVYTGVGNRGVQFGGKSLLLRSQLGPDLTIMDCQEQDRGFFIEEKEENPIVEGFTVTRGQGDFGGAVYAVALNPAFTRCKFVDNTATAHGGAVAVFYTATFTECEFRGNTEGSQGGGAVYASWGFPVFARCVFVENRSAFAGGAIFSDGASLVLSECTLSRNYAPFEGGAIWNFAADVNLDRSICYGNCAGTHPSEIYAFGTVMLRCSDIDVARVVGGAVVQDRVFAADPGFCDPRECTGVTGGGNYEIRSDSPCAPGGNDCAVLIGALDVGCVEQETGACCLPDLSCIELSQAECALRLGVYQGDNVPCEQGSCAPVTTRSSTWGAIKASFSRIGSPTH